MDWRSRDSRPGRRITSTCAKFTPVDFGVALDDRAGIVIVRVRGELDIHTAPELEAAVMPAVMPGARVIIDGQELEFTDSTGLSLFVKAHKRAADTGGRLDLVLVAPRVIRVVSMAGLMDILNVHGSLDDAIQAA